MGFSFRKSIGLGPLRLNLSKSGVGVSTGFRGARLSTGPRGTYVTFGRGGFRYQTRLGGSHSRSPSRHHTSARVDLPGNAPQFTREPQSVGATYIVNAPVAALEEISSDAMVADLQQRLARWNWFKPYIIAVGVACLFLMSASGESIPDWLAIAFAVLLLASAVAVYVWNRERRTARLFYDTEDPEVQERLNMCTGAASWLSRTMQLWHVYHAVGTSDAKHNAGATTLIRRTPTQCITGTLPRIKLNVQVGCVPLGPQRLLFLPDRLLVLEGDHLASVGYEFLQIWSEKTRFVEAMGAPSDAEFIEWTWEYVNKSGGPDRRFRSNRQMPVVRYGELHIFWQAGVRVVLQCSSAACSDGAAYALNALVARARGAVAPQG